MFKVLRKQMDLARVNLDRMNNPAFQLWPLPRYTYHALLGWLVFAAGKKLCSDDEKQFDLYIRKLVSLRETYATNSKDKKEYDRIIQKMDETGVIIIDYILLLRDWWVDDREVVSFNDIREFVQKNRDLSITIKKLCYSLGK